MPSDGLITGLQTVLRYVGESEGEPEVRTAHGLPNGDWQDVVDHISQFLGQKVTGEQAQKLFRIQKGNVVRFGADDRRGLRRLHRVWDWGPLQDIRDTLPEQHPDDPHTISVETYDPEGDPNKINPHNYSHLYLYRDKDGRPRIYGNYLVRPEGSKHPNGTVQMVDMLDQAKELGVRAVHNNAYTRLPHYVGSVIWPRLGFNDDIPQNAKERLPDHLKSATDMHTLLATPEGKKFWSDYVNAAPNNDDGTWSSLEHAVFDMDDPVAQKMLENYKEERYTKKKAKSQSPQTGTNDAPQTYSRRDRKAAGTAEDQQMGVRSGSGGEGGGESTVEGGTAPVSDGGFAAAVEVVLKYGLEDHASFQNAIAHNTEEDTPQLVYADWLEEQGKPAHADFIRQSVANYQERRQNPFHSRKYGGAFTTAAHPWEPGADFGVAAWHDQWPENPEETHQLDLSTQKPTGRNNDRRIVWTLGKMPKEQAVRWWDRLRKEGAATSHVSTISDSGAWGHDTDFHHEANVEPEKHSASDRPVKYSVVPDHDLHDDFKLTGVAPRVGIALNRLAQENSDIGLLAEHSLRTGDSGMLKILADKLDDDGHPAKDWFDWRHIGRGMDIDRALAGEHANHQHVRHNSESGVTRFEPQSAGWTFSDWSSGTRGRISRRRALEAVRKQVPDASRSDLNHSLLRLLDNQFVSQLSNPEDVHNFTPSYFSDIYPPDSRHTAHRTAYLQQLGEGKKDSPTQPDPHRYDDTRPLNKRYRLSALLIKYRAVKYGLEDEAAFHQKMLEDRHDRTTALVYADWLQEQGMDAHAELVRRHVEAQKRGPYVHTWHHFENPDLEQIGPNSKLSIGPGGRVWGDNRPRRSVSLRQKVDGPLVHVLDWNVDALPVEEADSLVKRLRAEGGEGAEKYASWKAPVGGMVVKESPHAVVGNWATGGQFSRNLEELDDQPTQPQPKKPNLQRLLKRWRLSKKS